MRMPGFNAEISLYKTGGHYPLAGGLKRADGVIPQLFFSPGCGPCHCDQFANCVQNCFYCVFGRGCYRFNLFCDRSACGVCRIR